MDLIVERVDVWAASFTDKPGGLADILTALSEAGADLNFILARRAYDSTGKSTGKGVVFVTPLRGDKEVAAAADLGFNVTKTIHSLSVEGENEPGIASEITVKIASAGITLRGFSAAIIGTRFIMYIGFDTSEDMKKALEILQN